MMKEMESLKHWWPRIYKEDEWVVIDLRCKSFLIVGPTLIIVGVMRLVGLI